ncbi:MAG: DUF6266 family protein [Salinivirgaceae bacterium]|nr:DUF6266 family protein [Salinivirgaceae bacterium]
MGKIPNGILGQISGKVGTVVGSSWKGESYIRALSGKSSKKATPSQDAVRMKFRIASEVVKPLMPFVKIGFAANTQHMTSRNRAMQQIITQCIGGDYPDFRVDYEKLKLAEGLLPSLIDGRVSSTATGTVDIRWVSDLDNAAAKPTDALLTAVYCPEINEAVVHKAVADRRVESVSLKMPAHFSGKTVHCYAAFVDSDALFLKAKPEAISNSSWLGSVVVL